MVRSDSTPSQIRKLGWLPAVLAAVCIGICFLNWSRLSGLKYGYFYGVFADPPSNGFSIGGPNHFQSMNVWYVVIITCLIIYVFGRFLGSRLGGPVIRLTALCVTVFPYYNMLDYKFYIRDIWNRYDWLENSFYLDIGCAAVIVGLLGTELLFVIRSSGSLTTISLDSTESVAKQ